MTKIEDKNWDKGTYLGLSLTSILNTLKGMVRYFLLSHSPSLMPVYKNQLMVWNSIETNIHVTTFW